VLAGTVVKVRGDGDAFKFEMITRPVEGLVIITSSVNFVRSIVRVQIYSPHALDQLFEILRLLAGFPTYGKT
jgi:hypothetical protein